MLSTEPAMQSCKHSCGARVFSVPGDPHTIFNIPACVNDLRKRGVDIVNSEADADVIVSSYAKDLLPYRIKYRSKKKYLVWCQEPRWDTHTASVAPGFLFLPPVHIINVYTGGIYLDNATMWEHCFDRELDINQVIELKKQNRIVTLMTYVKNPGSLIIKGTDVDLIDLRQRISLEALKRGMIDIFGKNWPIPTKPVSGGHFRDSKHELIQKYKFNLCMENTAWPYYCTEKIWDAIRAYCLPIYSSFNNYIYKDFPEESFIDITKFSSVDALLDFITNMDEDMWMARMALCIDVYNRIYRERLSGKKRFLEMLITTADSIKKIACSEL
jgi:hypothetical protein